MYRKTYALIDCDKLESNIKEITSKYSDYKYYFGVVKANSYGHGIESIKYLINGGINYLATSSLEEALKVRKLYKKIPILILEPIHYDDVIMASKNNITITIDNVDLFKKLVKNKINVKFHIKVDSGMNRFGFKNKEDIKYVYDNSNDIVSLEGIFTHLATGMGSEYMRELNNFKELTSLIDLNSIPIVHLDRSLTLEQHDKISFANGIRLGIVMYGFNKREYTPSLKRRVLDKLLCRRSTNNPSILKLDTVFGLYSEVIEKKSVKKGEIVGYSGFFKADEDILIGILPIGFADYLYINTSYVSINNKLYKVIANYMDVTAIIIDDSVKVGDKVEIFGNNISVRKSSSYANINVYKNICSVTNRVPRVYKYKNKEEEIEY